MKNFDVYDENYDYTNESYFKYSIEKKRYHFDPRAPSYARLLHPYIQ